MRQSRKQNRRFLFTLCGGLAAVTGRLTFANNVGPDMQNFNASPDGLDFVTVQSSETLKTGYWNFGLFVNQATGTLPKFPDDGTNRPVGKYDDTLIGMDINVATGVTNSLTLGISVPQILAQTVKTPDGVLQGEFLKTGTTEIRPMMKYHFTGSSRGGIAGIASLGLNMVEDNPYTGLGAPPIMNVEIAMDQSFGPFAAALNLGYRHRIPGKALTGAPVEPLSSQWIGSGAISTLINPIRSRVIAEVFGSIPVKATTNRSDRVMSAAEAIVGIKHMLTDNLALHGGVGRELTHGIASPDFRLHAGLNFMMGPRVEKNQKNSILRRHPTKKERAVVEDFVPEDSDDLIVNDTIPDNVIPPLGEETFIVSNVMFAFDRDNLVTPGGRDILRKLAVYLVKAPQFKQLTIEGHTDFIGSAAYNQELSLRRASQIMRYLVEVLRVDKNRVNALGYGESRPIADNGNFQGRQLNRRVEFKIQR